MDLLRACFLSERPAQEAWKRWTQSTDIENIDPVCHRLLPLIFRNPSLQDCEDPIFLKCKGVYRQTWTANQVRWRAVRPLLEQLLDAGMDKIILLKGMAMILHYYQDFGMRVLGDIDILVKRDQLPLIGPILSTSGWKQSSPRPRFDLNNPEHLNRWHSLNFQRSGVDIDLHWSFIEENCRELDDAVLKDALPSGRFYIPNLTDLLLQTCVHGIKYSPVPLIRWIPDAMIILKRSEIDWDRLVELGKKARLCLPLSSALQFLVDEFNAPIPKNALHRLKEVSPSRLERLEYKYNLIENGNIAAACRYCLNRGYHTLSRQVLHLHKYVQVTARLPSAWLVPFFALYWLFKRLHTHFLGKRNGNASRS